MLGLSTLHGTREIGRVVNITRCAAGCNISQLFPLSTRTGL